MLDLLLGILLDVTQAGGGGGFGGGGGGGGFSGGGGGGGGFSGGGGGGYSGGSYSGGEYSGELPPGILIPIIVIAILFAIAKHVLTPTTKEVRTSRTIRQARKVVRQQDLAQRLQAIQDRDAAFDQRTFLQRVSTGFVATQYAWSEQDLTPSRAFISDGVHERFELYIAMQKEEGIRNRMRDVAVVHHRIVAVESDDHFDTIHVKFRARAISYNESLTTRQRVSGNSDTRPINFDEIWSFSRRPGVATRTDATLYEGSCPNCGDTLEIVDRAQCGSCGSVINSGAYDWVLTEITQESEWKVPTQRRTPGLADLVEADPGINRQHLEDRASVIFWRVMMAIYFADGDLAAPVMPPGAEIPGRIRPTGDRYWFLPAVGSVTVLRAHRGEPGGMDTVFVEVRWSGIQSTGDKRAPRHLEEKRIHTDVLVLQRRSGITSDMDRVFSSFSCTNCGGPLDVGRAAECRFCGTPVNDGSTGWILVDIVTISAARTWGGTAPTRTPDTGALQTNVGERAAAATESSSTATAAPPVPEVTLRAMPLSEDHDLLLAVAAIAGADGDISQAERAELVRMGQRRGIAEEHMQEVIAGVGADDFEVPADPARRVAFLSHLVNAAFLDGLVTADEREILHRVARRMGWTDDRIDRLIDTTRATLKAEAERVLSEPPPMPD